MNKNDVFQSNDFGKFLLESRMVRSGKEKFLVHWVRKFFEYRISLPNLSWTEQVPLFIKEMNDSSSYQDWQIRQADQAVRLYFSNFLGTRSPSSSQVSGNSAVKSVTQQSALHSFRESLRLRHDDIHQ